MSSDPSLEVEAKFAVRDLDDLRRRLRDAGAEYVGRVLEINRFFDRPDGSLRNDGCGLRVRSAVAEDGPGRGATVTFKGPVLAGPYKTRRECEVEVSDAGRAAELLTALGFVETFRFEKRRETWRLGDCSVELDELPRIGRFVEIEGPSNAAVAAAQARLGCASAELIRTSYLGLLVRYCESQGVPSSDLRIER
jgi:adenylate cyclase class 2